MSRTSALYRVPSGSSRRDAGQSCRSESEAEAEKGIGPLGIGIAGGKTEYCAPALTGVADIMESEEVTDIIKSMEIWRNNSALI